MNDIKMNPCRHCQHMPGLSNTKALEYRMRCFNPTCRDKNGENQVVMTSQMATINRWNDLNPVVGIGPVYASIGHKEQVGDPYSRLRAVMEAAVDQAENGKGRERHANDNENFEDQQIVEISKRLSRHVAGAPLYQVVKKVYESGGLNKEMALSELYGAMNYLAAAIIVLEDC